MTNLIINSVILVILAKVSLAEDYSTTGLPLPTDCSLDGIDIFSIPEGDAYIVNTTIYDNMKDFTRVKYSRGQDTTYVMVDPPNRYVTMDSWTDYFRVEPVDEKIEISQPGHIFYYNFTLQVKCDGIYYPVEALIPIHETNTYTPIFSNKIYEYALFSPYFEDLERLLELNPIVANDNDMSNTEVIFSIEPNQYFDLQYEGVVPGSLNKNHTAKLIKKKSNLEVAKNLEFAIYVTLKQVDDIVELTSKLFSSFYDLGYPPKSSNATIRLKPSNIKVPTFKEPYYIGDYYLNNTFEMRSQPELDITGIGKNYKINAAIIGNPSDYFVADVIGNGTVAVIKRYILPELTIYKYNYLSYILKVTYTDTSLSNYVTYGYATILIELHH